MGLMLNGSGVARGIAVGTVRVLRREQPEVVEYAIPAVYIEEEVRRFESALDIARTQLEEIRGRIPAGTPLDIAAFIDTHLLMLSDSALSQVPRQLIREERFNAEWALVHQRNQLVRAFEQIQDPYLRARAADVDYVVNRVLRILTLQTPHTLDQGDDHLRGAVIFTPEISPAELLLLYHCGIVAVVTEYGSSTSHSVILARSLGLPTIVGLRHASAYVREQESVLVDGERGVILLGDDRLIVQYFRLRLAQERRHVQSLVRLKGRPAMTRDGVAIKLYANIDVPEDIETSLVAGADGIGLYRTEFLFLNRADLPGEEEQFQVYRNLLAGFPAKPVVIRTLDLGADKLPRLWCDESTLKECGALGMRAIRVCLHWPELFRTQLRALLRAAPYGKMRLLFPMLTTLDEARQCLQWIAKIKEELNATHIEVACGGMIEVPGAALMAASFARQLHFLSVGTNDLVQYTLATNRGDGNVAYLYDQAHPAVLRLLRHVIRAGQRVGVPVSLCGEMAGDARYTRLLLGLGLTEFSAHPSLLLEIKSIIAISHRATLQREMRAILALHDDIAIARRLQPLMMGLSESAD